GALGRTLPAGAYTAMTVRPLERADARELARRILGPREVDLDLLLTESGGTPYYLTELCRRARELSPEQAAHLRLSDVIGERLAADPEALVLHLEGAGDPVRAAGFAVAAAEQAEEALAFDRAAALYAVALAHPPADTSLADLWRRRADALVAAGRGGDAAEA